MSTSLRDRGGVRLTLTPSVITIDSKEKKTTIEFWNNTPDTLNAEIAVFAQAPKALMTELTTATVKKKKPLRGLLGAIVDDDTASNTTKDTARRHTQSLAPWVEGVPPKLRLAPNEKRVINVTVNIPDSVESGVYECWIVTLSTPVESGKTQRGGFRLMGPNGKPLRPPSFTKLLFTRP